MRLFDSIRPCLLRSVLAAFLAGGPVILFHPQQAQAQAVDEAEAEQDAMNAQQREEDQKKAKHAAPPSAIPGADQNADDKSHSRLDLNPTAALFDAVNKGSMLATKEALSRGADVNARNILDQTALDMAIDLGRNDIMFLLLSMKTYNPDGRLTTSAAHETVTDKQGRKKVIIDGQMAMTRAGRKVHFVSDGGHPQPGVGFLGFNGPQTSHSATPAATRRTAR
ncbi:ankyrin repeat domain-containing protein [Acetobacteraceae bacterium ESL0709]|nr:ankyrin repeat domain-containing protein [Acetobacteraceae bacterium ESL0697]MDF7678651.1 ankyrin repeat domain-containing protein [Acetobacteraceae bacterium ESL0709]